MAARSISRPFLAQPRRRHFVDSAATALLHWSSHWQHDDGPNVDNRSSLRVVCVSDTHNTQPQLSDGDILLHAGDLSQYGTFDEIQGQLDWLNSQPHQWKVIIAGNHDLLLDESFVNAYSDRELGKPGRRREDLQWGNLIHLHNSSVVLDTTSRIGRKLKIFGCPLTPKFGNFAFQYDPQDGYDIWRDLIPPDTDILLTHGPPVGHLDDGGKGCVQLLKELWRVQPRLVLFGHIHAGYGRKLLWFDGAEESYENIVLNRKPWLNLFRMIWRVLCLVLSWMLLDSNQRTNHSELINAAVVGEGLDQKKRMPVITFI